MPPLQLTSLLQDTLPHLSYNGRALISALGCVNGRTPGSQELASWLGFHDRYQLARAMRREGLPPLETLGGWARTLYWLLESETSGATLRKLAERDNLDPAVAYRLIRRITGRRWSEIRRDGMALAFLRFREKCRDRLAVASPAPADRSAEVPSRRVSLGSLSGSIVGSRRPVARLAGTLRERVPVSGAPFDVAVTSTDLALVTRGHAAAIEVLRLGPPRVVDTIQVGPVPTRVVPNGRGDLAYVTSQFSEAVDVVDLTLARQTAALHLSGRAVRDIAIPHGSPQICKHPSGRRIYASGFRSGLIAEIEVPALRPLRTFDVRGIVQEVAVTADGQMLYAANECGWIDAIHLASGKRAGRLHLGSAALGLALSADQADVVIGLLHAGRVVIVDRERLAVRATLHTGGTPRLMATHPQGHVLVANEAGWVDFID